MEFSTLTIPKERLEEVIDVIQAGLFELRDKSVSEATRKQLKTWCLEGQAYLLKQYPDDK